MNNKTAMLQNLDNVIAKIEQLKKRVNTAEELNNQELFNLTESYFYEIQQTLDYAKGE